jgi:hypothetical protein
MNGRLCRPADIATSVGLLSSTEFALLLSRGARKNVRGKRRGVNSVFLVQLRKMAGGELWCNARLEIFHRDMALGLMNAACRAGRRIGPRRFRHAGRQIVHRGAQEMQKAVGVVTRGQS